MRALGHRDRKLMIRSHYGICLVLAVLGMAYAWWTQPYVGPASTMSVVVRSVLIGAWLALFVVVKNMTHATWSWKHFVIGAVFGGGCLSLTFPMGDTATKSLVILSMGVVLGAISGLFAALVSTRLRAAITGVGVLVAQLIVGVAVHGLGWTKFSYGM